MRRQPPLVKDAVAVLGARGRAVDVDVDGKHLKLRWVSNAGRRQLLVIARSPSDRRAGKNVQAILKRMLRDEEARP